MIESIINEVCEKYRPEVEALQAQLESDEGISLTLPYVMSEEEKQKILFQHLFNGLDKPLKLCSSIG